MNINDDPRQCWRTPRELFDALNRHYRFEVDAAANADNHLCPEWYGPGSPFAEDGLCAQWNKPVFCNPGFSMLHKWVPYAALMVKTLSRCPLACVVVHHAPSSLKWWESVTGFADDVLQLTPRVNFIPAPGVPKSSNPRETDLIVFRRGPILSCGPRFSTFNWKGN